MEEYPEDQDFDLEVFLYGVIILSEEEIYDCQYN
jgi:hypothetical protein